ncbi:hypothetical protein [Alicyclobacillus fodiniaquatilis]|uniref:Lipoprotein n=1 Tax=Alicyclobacillus fodiniaquatilis TaxID=1661150 RepID=A0ABW4JQF7_9BACL
MKVRQTFVTAMLTITSLGLVAGCGTPNQPSGSSKTTASTNSSNSSSPRNWSGAKNHPYGGMGMMMNTTELTKILGISSTVLQNDLKAKKSLVQIASSKNISEATLIKDLESSFKTGLESQVKSGKMSSSQEQKMISMYDSHVKSMVEQKGMPQRPTESKNWTKHTNNNSSK